jgi:hypothetical protein
MSGPVLRLVDMAVRMQASDGSIADRTQRDDLVARPDCQRIKDDNSSFDFVIVRERLGEYPVTGVTNY